MPCGAWALLHLVIGPATYQRDIGNGFDPTFAVVKRRYHALVGGAQLGRQEDRVHAGQCVQDGLLQGCKVPGVASNSIRDACSNRFNSSLYDPAISRPWPENIKVGQDHLVVFGGPNLMKADCRWYRLEQRGLRVRCFGNGLAQRQGIRADRFRVHPVCVQVSLQNV